MLKGSKTGIPGPLTEARDKPNLIVDYGDLPASAGELRDSVAYSGELLDRGVPVSLVKPDDVGPLRRRAPLRSSL
jgi:hypothetical protein